MIRATVSLRGSRSGRTVNRDATPPPRGGYPNAALAIHTGRRSVAFELSFQPILLAEGAVMVQLARYTSEDGRREVVFAEEVKP